MATWGTGLVAIASGFLGDASVKGMGLLAPFNLAIGVRDCCFAEGYAQMVCCAVVGLCTGWHGSCQMVDYSAEEV